MTCEEILMTTDSEQNIVYILTNPCFPDWIKIGRCKDLKKRVSSLSNNTAVPLPFDVFYACTVPDSKKVESKLFDIFAPHRISAKREFFSCDPEQVVKVLDLVKIEDVEVLTGNDDEEELLAGAKLILGESKFLFSEAGISLGSEIYMTREPSLVANVIDQHTVSFEGKKWDFTELTKHLLASHFDQKSLKISAPRYWSQDGEMLVSLRRKRLDHSV